VWPWTSISSRSGIAVHRRDHRIEDVVAVRLDRRLVVFEVDRLQRGDAALDPDDHAAIRTAVGVLVAVVGLGLVGALVVLVRDPVVIVVGIGAAVARSSAGWRSIAGRNPSSVRLPAGWAAARRPSSADGPSDNEASSNTKGRRRP
jgi:hypothetical protein